MLRLRQRGCGWIARSAVFALLALSLTACADQDARDDARLVDSSQQSGLGKPEQAQPIVAPPAAGQDETGAPRYQWNGNPQRVIEGKSGDAGAKRPQLKPQPPASDTAANVPSDAQVVEVQPGDTLNGIAARYGVTVASLNQANALSGAPLRPGQKLTLPPTAR